MPALPRQASPVLSVLRRHVGPCREWVEEKADSCGADAEYLLWGKLIPAEGLGPRCYDHAAEHVGHNALWSHSDYALVNLADLEKDIAGAL